MIVDTNNLTVADLQELNKIAYETCAFEMTALANNQIKIKGD